MESRDHCSKMMSKMFNFTQNQSLCDLSILADDEIFDVHKCVFAAASPTLKEMITKETKEQKGGIVRIFPNNVTAMGVQLLIVYVYTGKLPGKDNCKSMKAFEQACNFFGVSCGNSLESQDPLDTNDVLNGISEKSEINISNICKENKNPIKLEITSQDICVSEVSKYQSELAPYDDTESNVDIGEIFEDNVESQSQVVVQIIDPDDYSSDSDESFHPVIVEQSDDSSESEMDEDLTIKSRTRRGKENVAKSKQLPGKKRKHETNKSSTKSKLVRGIDINSLFSVKKKSSGKNDRLFKFEPDNAIRRGRPKAANDSIFPNDPPFVCPHENCDRVYDTRDKCKKHYRSHEEKKHGCELCGRKFMYNKDLICHMRIHTGEKPFACDKCSAKFAQKSTLTCHMKVHNMHGNNFYCDLCGQQYRSAKGLQSHIKLHTKEGIADEIGKGKSHNCPICAKWYSTEVGVKQHIKRKHPDSDVLKDMPVLRRGRKPKREIELRTSYKIHESAGETVIEFTEVSGEEEEVISEYICPHCGSSMNDENGYLKHLTDCGKGETHYICGECGDTFDTEAQGAEHECASDKTHAERLNAVAAAVSSIGGAVTSEGYENVKILNLETMFQS